MQVTFWGVRGSLPACGAEFTEFGGHTNCLQVQVAGHNLVFDMGTGAQALGQHLLQQTHAEADLNAVPVQVFLSHYHLDHVGGLPFFKPLYHGQTQLEFYGMGPVQEQLQRFMGPPFFPVCLQDTRSTKTYHSINLRQPLWLSQHVCISSLPVAHPGGCLAYRIDYYADIQMAQLAATSGQHTESSKSLVYLTDYEHNTNGQSVCDELADFCEGVSLLIYDANYDDHQFSQYKGFGHSTWQAGVQLATGAKVQQLALVHHGIDCSDDTLKHREQQAKVLFGNSFFARQGQTLEL